MVQDIYGSGRGWHKVPLDSPSLPVRGYGENKEICRFEEILLSTPRLGSILSFSHLAWSLSFQVSSMSVFFNFHSKLLGNVPLRNIPEIPGPVYLAHKHRALGHLTSAETVPWEARESNRRGEAFLFQEGSLGDTGWSFKWRISKFGI